MEQNLMRISDKMKEEKDKIHWKLDLRMQVVLNVI